MNVLQRLHQWDDAHPVFHFVLRVALGLLLMLKGIQFMSNSQQLAQMLEQSGFSAWRVFLVSYITFAHLLGGFLIVIGLFTRIAIILQIPILLGAIFFVNLGTNAYGSGSELALSIIALLLLVYFLINGGGEISTERYAKEHLL